MQEFLKRYIQHGRAFGPIDAGVIQFSQSYISIIKKLFDPQNKIYSALNHNPSIVIGRRGSGKTAYLRSSYLENKFSIVQEISPSEIFCKIISSVEKNISTYVTVESVSNLWEELFYLSLMHSVSDKCGGNEVIDDFIARVDPDFRKNKNVENFLWTLLNSANEKISNNTASVVSSFVKNIAGVSFLDVKQEIVNILKNNKWNAILLLDSLEQYPIDINNVTNALAGLLKCVGQFNEKNEWFNVRVCLPAELYHVFLDLSTNPHKDLSPHNTLTLHWIAGELLSVAAHRLALYINLYFPEKIHDNVNPSRREDIRNFFHSYLPNEVKNGLGVYEDSVAYILRHTQLQPRHLLIYLNAIFEEQRKRDDRVYPKIQEEAVRAGIAATEALLTREVFSGYKMLYPKAKDICESCIPELSLSFSHSKLQQVFNRHGKKFSGSDDFLDFRRVLIETGIIGKVVDETDRYIIGRFEYTEPHKLVVSMEDELCLHPVFAQVFNCKMKNAHKTIYPYGSDPDGEDHRSWQFAD